jgi:ATP-binding cassette subfamily B (MDR/TAP) protein 9
MAYLLSLSRFLSITTLVVCTMMGAVMYIAGQYQQIAARVVQDTLAKANEVAEESFSLAKMVRTFGTEMQESNR